MEAGAAEGDVDGVAPADENCVVVFRGSRHQARVMGSTLGPTVLAPGPEQGWQVLVPLSGATPGDMLSSAIRFATTEFGLDEPPALSLHRSGTTWWIGVPVSRAEFLVRTWVGQPSHAADSEIVEELAQHLVTMTPEASLQDVLEVLRDERVDGRPLCDLVALLGLPTIALDMLEVDEPEVPARGQLLIRADKRAHGRAWAKAHSAERWASDPLAIDEGRFGPEGLRRASDRVFGVVYIALGVVAMMLGAACLLLDIRPESSLLGVDHPAGWVVLGAAMVWFGSHARKRGARRSVRTHEGVDPPD